MLVRLFNLLLVAAILGCPLVCRSGSAAGAANSCCCHGHKQGLPQPPENSEHDSSTFQQCICSGAVLEDASFDVQPDVNWSIAPLVMETAAFQLSVAQITEFLTAPPPDGAANPGRVLRCLHMSFLC